MPRPPRRLPSLLARRGRYTADERLAPAQAWRASRAEEVTAPKPQPRDAECFNLVDKVTSPAGEEFELAGESANRVLVKGVVAVLDQRTERLYSIKEGDMFLFADAEGNLDAEEAIGAGLYYRDTRFLSDSMLTVDERIRVKNYNAGPVTMRIELTLGSDFADIFEVRGLKRSQRGKLALPKADGRSAVLAYLGQDGVFRETRITFDLEPTEVEVVEEKVRVRWEVHLEPTQTEVLALVVEPRIAGRQADLQSFDNAVHQLRRSYEEWERACTRVWTDNELYNSLLTRAVRDLRALLTPTEHGDVVAAGIPWFVAPFGRDALMTCHQTLMINPELTRTTIEVLASYQADEVDTWRDAEPGKILHEFRQGELAAAHVIPHSPYYGSVDSTPLWLLLLGTYYRWTADLDFCRALLPTVERALHWVDHYGDLDADGFF